MRSKAMPSSLMDAGWQAECDARALMASSEVQGDKKRMSSAQKALSKMEEEATKTLSRVQALKAANPVKERKKASPDKMNDRKIRAGLNKAFPKGK